MDTKGDLNIKDTVGKTEREGATNRNGKVWRKKSDFMENFTKYFDHKLQSEHQMKILSRQFINYGNTCVYY